MKSLILLFTVLIGFEHFFVSKQNPVSAQGNQNPVNLYFEKDPSGKDRCHINQPELDAIETVSALPKVFKFKPDWSIPSKPSICMPLNVYREKLYGKLNMKVPTYNGSKKIKIAVIDTGLDFSIPAFKNKIYRPDHRLPENFYGFDLTSMPNKNYFEPKDNNGHGTHVAGIIIGLFPNAEILPIKYYDLPSNDEFDGSMALAIRLAVAAGVDIINISGGGLGMSEQEMVELRRADDNGILVVAASGNDNSLLAGENKFYPASYQMENIISVMSHNDHGQKSKFSNYGTDFSHIAALGEIYSYVPNHKNKKQRCIGFMAGTSQATPFVTATAAMLMSKNPSWDYHKVKGTILSSVDKTDAMKDLNQSAGTLNIYRTIAKNE